MKNPYKLTKNRLIILFINIIPILAYFTNKWHFQDIIMFYIFEYCLFTAVIIWELVAIFFFREKVYAYFLTIIAFIFSISITIPLVMGIPLLFYRVFLFGFIAEQSHTFVYDSFKINALFICLIVISYIVRFVKEYRLEKWHKKEENKYKFNVVITKVFAMVKAIFPPLILIFFMTQLAIFEHIIIFEKPETYSLVSLFIFVISKTFFELRAYRNFK